MAKWDYRVCAVKGDAPGNVEEQLNAALKTIGDEGWRFVETIYAQHSLPLLLFKKQAKTGGRTGSEKL